MSFFIAWSVITDWVFPKSGQIIKSLNRSHKSKSGAAIMLDLKGSTTVWQRNHDVALEALRRLTHLIQSKLHNLKSKGVIGNFTGDGFLVLIDNSTESVNFCADLIKSWEEYRLQFMKTLDIQDKNVLILRAGVAHGEYYLLGKEFCGTTINLAQRIESESKQHQLVRLLKNSPHFRVFTCQTIYRSLSDSDFIHADLGDFKPSGIDIPHRMYAVWPTSLLGGDTSALPEKEFGVNLIDAQYADGLILNEYVER